MLQFYFLHVCGRIYCSTSLACIVFCFTSRNVRNVVCVRHFTGGCGKAEHLEKKKICGPKVFDFFGQIIF